MQTLSVLAVEDGVIIVASAAGERFRLPLDAALRARIASPSAASASEKRLSPREIQAHVRSGLTADQVAAMTGVPVAFIERFVGPVLAERAYIVESALAVRLPPETEGARSRTFGAVMGERLDALAAKDVRWTSAKEPSGWVLAVAFTADDLQHSARWRFDAKHMRLDADNVEASTLSQQGVPAALTPRLRAIEPTAPVTVITPEAAAAAPEPPRTPPLAPPHGARVAPVPPAEPDRSRFDSAVFRFPAADLAPRTQEAPTAPAPPTTAERTLPTTDQLAQLQRRRGERQPAPAPDADTGPLTVTRAMEVAPPGDVFARRPVEERREPAARRDSASVHQLPVRRPVEPLDDPPPEPVRRRRDRVRPGREPGEPADTRPAPVVEAEEAVEVRPQPVRPRRGRTSMPSWDEIVFGRDEP
ncbi:septation protein SepH [uncultured Amnibacterium sp.]|uniref:septation protein SepH n=1 Tax=uncultured Amnibacterium sp. TaxID=1631851 RepID=UPI0035C9AF1D